MAGADFSSAGMVREGCPEARLCGFFGVAAAAAREAAFPRGGWQPLRNKERAELALASRRAALHRATLATLLLWRSGENPPSGGLSGASERYLGGPNGAGRRGDPRPPADKTDSSLRRRPRFTPYAVAGTRSGPRASALLKDHRGAAQAQAFRRRRAPTGWAACP